MNVHLSTPTGGRMTVEQFLDWAQAQTKGRYELVDGVPVKMSPERNQHALVKGAVYRALVAAVEQARIDCVVFPDGPMVVIDRDRSRGPDVVVQAGPAFDPNALTVERPVVLVEVTSPTTMCTDTDDKLIEYFSVASVHHYVLVHPDRHAIVHHRRVEGNAIETRIASQGTLKFDPPGFEVDIDRFFSDLPVGKAN